MFPKEKRKRKEGKKNNPAGFFANPFRDPFSSAAQPITIIIKRGEGENWQRIRKKRIIASQTTATRNKEGGKKILRDDDE